MKKAPFSLKKITALLFLLFLLFTTAHSEESSKKLTVHFFGASTCSECNAIKTNLLRPLDEKYESLVVKDYDILVEKNLNTLFRFQDHYSTMGDAISLFVADTFLLGYNNIMKNGKTVILEKMDQAVDEVVLTESDVDHIEDQFRNINFWFLTLTGLADGINPCAIATMIFLISFLTTQKLKFKQTLIVGQTYILAVFLTYFAIGFGTFNALRGLEEIHIVSSLIKWAAILLCTFVAVLSIRDGIVFHKTKNIKDIKLQLSDTVKMKIHDIIKTKLTGKNLIISAAITGFLVTLFETMCTFQTYLPVLTVMQNRGTHRIQVFFYLLYYNFLFIVPLQIVMIAAYKGMTWNSLAKRTQKNMVAVKFIIASVMIALAYYLFRG